MQDKIKKLLNLIEEDLGKSEKNTITTEALRGMYDRLSKIHQDLSIEKFEIVFIAPKSYGKTTTISQSFDLIIDDEKKSKVEREELLMTGRGSTTLCEVSIEPSNVTYIEVKCYTKEETLKLIENYAIETWREYAKGEKTTIGDSEKYIPEELERAILNLLSTSNQEIEEIINEIQEKNGQYEDFIKLLQQQAQLDLRVEDTIYYDGLGDEKKWILNNFIDLNLARNPIIGIPKRISLHINKGLLNLDKFEYVDKIIDTRGLDLKGLNYREDIDSYFNNYANKIYILVDKFPSSLSSPLANIVEKYRKIRSMELEQRSIILINYENVDLEEFVGQNGYMEEDQVLIEKEKRLSKALKNIGLTDAGNLLFYNPLLLINKKKGKKIFELEDVKEINTNNYKLTQYIEKIVLERKERLQNELNNIEETFYKSINEFFTENDKMYLQIIKDNVNQLLNSKPNVKQILEKYREEVENIHPAVLDALNRGFGEYHQQSIYIMIKDLVMQEIYEQLEKDITKILNNIEEQYKYDDSSNCYKMVLNSLKNLTITLYDEFKLEIAEIGKETFSSDVVSPKSRDIISNNIWNKVIGRYGKKNSVGRSIPGYRKDVIEYYQLEMTQKDFINKMANIIDLKWQEKIVDGYKSFFAE